jgi:hypothetical protein
MDADRHLHGIERLAVLDLRLHERGFRSLPASCADGWNSLLDA